MLPNRTGPFLLVAIVIVGCLGAGIWLSISPDAAPPLVISVTLACSVSALLYGILGSVGEAGFKLGPLKMGGSAAVLIGSTYLFNWLLEPQLDAIRAETVEEALRGVRFDFDRHAEPARGWFAIDRETADPVSVRFVDPVSGMVAAEVDPPARAALRFTLTEREASSDHLVSGVDADAGLGFITRENLERMLGLISGLEPGATHGPRRLHLVNEGELPPEFPRTWGDGRCLGTRLPLLIRVNRFEGGYADHEVFPCESGEGVESSLRSGEAELHQFEIDGRLRNFVIAVVAADHRAPPFWSSFVVIELIQPGD
ncbi:MAG: hypothetical protein OXQ89_05595 [Rhodospirillaceae bacterium]|nr:hypothetical protein [Rhodospirillaceae bacterium]MDD9997200.1 hypothetical protein [Rhodospirillaceae bacterium]MDE0362401.1 hypothetical protein [Rhodospirillaceae bacterium]